MQLKSKYYPYPVIVEDGEYYEGSSFTSNILEYTNEGYNFRIKIEAKLKDDQLLEMIERGDVLYSHHIECPQTYYRHVFCTKNPITEIVLKDTEVNGLVQVCSFVIANKHLDRYTNNSFSSDYRGWKFNIDKGCFMAIGNQNNIQIDKLRDDLANTTSIFSIVKNTDPLADTMKVNLSSTKIIILLPEETYKRYINIQNSVEIVPVLIYVFSELREADEQLYEYENYRWFRGLKKACNKINIILDEQSLKSMDIMRTSQLLLNSPLIKAIENCTLGDDVYED